MKGLFIYVTGIHGTVFVTADMLQPALMLYVKSLDILNTVSIITVIIAIFHN